jgi:hypothetical protein
MNRKLALAGSLSAAVALVSGAVMVGTLLSASPGHHTTPDLAVASVDTESATVTSLDPVVVYQDEYELVASGQAAPASGSAAPGSSQEVSGAVSGPASGFAAGGSSVVPAVSSPVVTTPPVTAAPAPATTTTTRPPGVPSDWPPDKPIPPMPPGCREPQLEDNGVWNCQR